MHLYHFPSFFNKQRSLYLHYLRHFSSPRHIWECSASVNTTNAPNKKIWNEDEDHNEKDKGEEKEEEYFNKALS